MFSFSQLKTLNDTVSQGDYSRSIIHYTSENSLTNILQSSELWMGRIDQMNDATEFRHYADAVKLVVHELVPHASASLVQSLFEGFENQIKDQTYLSSWCEYYDSEPEGRLPMWLSYGDNASGVAAVVDSSQMQPSTITHSRFSYFVATSQVEYVHKDQVKETADRLLHKIRKSGVLKAIPNSEAVLGGMLIARAPTSKHQSFREEREVRFLTMPEFSLRNGRYSPPNRLRQVNGREYFSLELKNWHEYDLDLRLSTILQKILVGPRNKPHERAERMRDVLQKAGLGDVPVEIVDIPLRD